MRLLALRAAYRTLYTCALGRCLFQRDWRSVRRVQVVSDVQDMHGRIVCRVTFLDLERLKCYYGEEDQVCVALRPTLLD